jgi:NADH-quinone oxidoreductase subunit M
MVFTLANVGLPGTTGYIGEFLSLNGTFKVNTWVATLAATGLILSACYALWLYRQVIFGVLDKPSLAHILDLSAREIVTFAPLVVLTIVFGVYPKPVLDMSAASVAALLENYQHRVAGKSAVQASASRADFPVGPVEMLSADPDKVLVKIKYIKTKPESRLLAPAATAPIK